MLWLVLENLRLVRILLFTLMSPKIMKVRPKPPPTRFTSQDIINMQKMKIGIPMMIKGLPEVSKLISHDGHLGKGVNELGCLALDKKLSDAMTSPQLGQ